MCRCFIKILVSAVSWKVFVCLRPRVLSMALGRRSRARIQAVMPQNWPGFSSAAHPESVMTHSFSQFIKKIFSFSTCKPKKMILTQVPHPSSALLLSRDISRRKLSSSVTVQALCLLSVTNCFCRCSSHVHHQDVERGTTSVPSGDS